MSFRWIYRDTPKTTAGGSDAFDSQAGAEEWMGDHWRELLDRGILAASLMDGDTELYTMSLEAG